MRQKIANIWRYEVCFIGAVFVNLKRFLALGLVISSLLLMLFLQHPAMATEVEEHGFLETMPNVSSELQFILGQDEIDTEAEDVTQEVGKNVLIIGDSLTVFSEEVIEEYLPEATVDAISGTHFNDENYSYGGLGRLEKHDLDDVSIIVFVMGTNAGITADDMAKLLEIAGDRQVILMTIYRPLAHEGAEDANADFVVGDSNALVWKTAFLQPNVTVIDWADLIATAERESDFLFEDRLHPNTEGQTAFASLMRDAIWAVNVSAMDEAEVATHDAEPWVPDSVWVGLAVFAVVLVIAWLLSMAVGLGRLHALVKRELARQEWQRDQSERKKTVTDETADAEHARTVEADEAGGRKEEDAAKPDADTAGLKDKAQLTDKDIERELVASFDTMEDIGTHKDEKTEVPASITNSDSDSVNDNDGMSNNVTNDKSVGSETTRPVPTVMTSLPKNSKLSSERAKIGKVSKRRLGKRRVTTRKRKA